MKCPLCGCAPQTTRRQPTGMHHVYRLRRAFSRILIKNPEDFREADGRHPTAFDSSCRRRENMIFIPLSRRTRPFPDPPIAAPNAFPVIVSRAHGLPAGGSRTAASGAAAAWHAARRRRTRSLDRGVRQFRRPLDTASRSRQARASLAGTRGTSLRILRCRRATSAF